MTKMFVKIAKNAKNATVLMGIGWFANMDAMSHLLRRCRCCLSQRSTTFATFAIVLMGIGWFAKVDMGWLGSG